jgi:ABC-type transport system involved in multi-copper enzyme maturation permease subunit
MTRGFLPIVERELRLVARRKSTFWIRFGAATGAVLLVFFFGGLDLLFGHLSGARSGVGIMQGLFPFLSWILFLASLGAGVFFTSDCLSEEKREGTLGFLFLTDLRSFDIVTGKLAATSMRVLCTLLAVFPVLALALLFGRVTGGEVFRTLAAILVTFAFSQTAGMMVSSLSRKPLRAMTVTMALVAGVTLLPPALDAWICRNANSFEPRLSYISPGFFFVSSASARAFWPSLLGNGMLFLAFLGVACVVTARVWRVSSSKTESRGAVRRRRRMPRLLQRDPALWLIAPPGWHSWVLVLAVAGCGVMLAWPLISDSRSEGQNVFMVGVVASRVLAFALMIWTASSAPRFLAEARRSGALELLLSTPLDSSNLVRAQWRALLREFGPAILLLGALLLAQNLMSMLIPDVPATPGSAIPGGLQMGGIFYLVTGVCTMVVLMVEFVAMSWVGMWMGLRARNAGLATLFTFLIVIVGPGLAHMVLAPVVMIPTMVPAMVTGGGTLNFAWLWLPTAVTTFVDVGIYVGLTLWARKQLTSRFREVAAHPPGMPLSRPYRPAPPPMPAAPNA